MTLSTSKSVADVATSPADAPLYIHLMSSHLKKIADETELAFVAYLLSMVVEEAGVLTAREEE